VFAFSASLCYFAAMKLSPREKQILEIINKQIQNKGFPPSVREIGQAVGLSSSSTVHAHLAALEKKGYLKRDQSKPRALTLAKNKTKTARLDSSVVSIPVLGSVAAGNPILAVAESEEKISLPAEFFKPNYFAVKVKGDSMVNTGILDGDLIIVKPQPVAEAGAIVVALLDDEVTVKYFYPQQNKVKLEAANPAYPPIYTDNLKILGIAVGLLRPQL